MKTLIKLSWKTRKFKLSFELLTLYFNDYWHGWGFDFFKIGTLMNSYSLLKFCILLPNGTTRMKLCWHGDVLFIKTLLLKIYSDISDGILWGNRVSNINKFMHRILKYIFA
jgi:hypothetical protein